MLQFKIKNFFKNKFFCVSGSYEQSPRFLTGCGRERFGTRRCDSESSITDMVPKVEVELQLKENLADAMMEMPSAGSNVPGNFYFVIVNPKNSK